jgi:PAS domain S-box-containing protein
MLKYFYKKIFQFLQMRWLVLVCFITILISPNLYAQKQFSREEVIASYIYNFALNTKWANEDEIDKFNFKLVGNNKKIYEELSKLVATKEIRKKKIKVTTETHLTSFENTQLIYVSGENNESIVNIFYQIEGRNILLITDNYENPKIVMINFYDTKDHKLKFEINKANILNQGLSLLPDMVLLGGTEVDVAKLYKESQVSLGTLQKQVEALQQHVQELKTKIEKSEFEITNQQQVINSQNAAVERQTTQLAAQKLELLKLHTSINLKQNTLNMQMAIISQHEKEINKQKEEIVRREKVLNAQHEKIENQKAEIKKQETSLQEQDITISEQKNIVYFSIIISLLGISLFVAIFRGYKEKQKVNTLLTKEIEERERVEKALGKSEDLYNNAPCGYHSLDKNGIFVGINDTELKWLGYQRDEIVGKIRFTDIITDNSRKLFEERFLQFKASGIILDVGFDMVRKDGSVLPILLNATAITDQDGSFLMSRSTIFDNTIRKQAEEEIHKFNEELEQRVNDRTAQLEASNKELEAFSYSVSHDLRAPLRHISGYIDLIQRRFSDSLPEKGHEFLVNISESTIQMGALIDDLLQFSRTGRQELKYDELNMYSLVEESVRAIQYDNVGRNIDWIIKTLPTIWGDGSLLKLVWMNLLSNAAKFTRKKEKAIIEIECKETENEYIFSVRDNGAGFDMQYSQKLFGVFQRLHSTSEYEGTGIGLANVQRIITRHGGRVWAEAEVEKGAIFYFTLPKKEYNHEELKKHSIG